MADDYDQFLRICVREQLDELKMLHTIFGYKLKINDYLSVVSSFTAFVEINTAAPVKHLQFELPLELSPAIKIVICFQLPLLYPFREVAAVSVRSADLVNPVLANLHKELNVYLDTLVGSKMYVYKVYQWIQEWLLLKTTPPPPTTTNTAIMPVDGDHHQEEDDGTTEMIEMERLWIRTPLLECQTQRQDLVNLGKMLNLTGFHRPGRPGIICIEGPRSDVFQFWRALRKFPWEKHSVRRRETKRVKSGAEFRKFNDEYYEKIFTSLFLDANVDGSSELEAMNMELFLEFLERHGCADVKKCLFGFD